MSYILSGLVKLPIMGYNYLFNIYIILLSVIVVYVFNIVVGLLPVFMTIRKTPAQILSRIDAD